jgi:predicted double-glycine peptidase
VKTEQELRVLTDSDFDSTYYPGGAEAGRVVDAAKALGFPNTSKNNLMLQELVEIVVVQGRFPIVQIAIRLQPDTPLQTHAVVVIRINQEGVLILDPAQGEILLSQAEFDAMWQLRRGLAILVG